MMILNTNMSLNNHCIYAITAMPRQRGKEKQTKTVNRILFFFFFFFFKYNLLLLPPGVPLHRSVRRERRVSGSVCSTDGPGVCSYRARQGQHILSVLWHSAGGGRGGGADWGHLCWGCWSVGAAVCLKELPLRGAGARGFLTTYLRYLYFIFK